MDRIVVRAIIAFPVLLTGSILVSPARAGGPVEALGEVQPGFYSSSNAHTGGFLARGDEALFVAWDPQHGREPRRFDGTDVSLIEDVWAGPVSGLQSAAAAFGGRFYFAADDGALGTELWRTDGVADGTLPVVDLCPGSCDGLEGAPLAAGGVIWFAGSDGLSGFEPWITDGTAAGTRRVADVCPGACSSHPEELTELNGRVYFTADGPGGEELWVSDGTAAGTVQVTDLCPGPCDSRPERLTAWAGHLYFGARLPKDGQQVWRTGPSGTVERVTDLDFGYSWLRRLVPFADRLYIVRRNSTHLWRTDGTLAGTRPASELPPSRELFPNGDRLFLATGSELWVLEASANFAHRIASGFNRAPAAFAPFGEGAVFGAGTAATGIEPWITDGTAAGTRLLADAVPGSQSSAPTELAQVGDRVLFSAGGDPWITDGTVAGTRRLAELARPLARDFIGLIAPLGEHAFFMPHQPPPMSLWRTDGTAPGTEAVMTWGFLSGWYLETLDGRLYIVGTLDETRGLYVTDGTVEGTELISPEGSQVTSALGRVWFSTVSHGQQLWVTDGTAAGTQFVADVNPGYSTVCPIMCLPIPDYPRLLTDARERLFFVAFEPGSPLQLWVSDGTAAGTQPLRTFPDPDPGPAEMIGHQGGALFPSYLAGGGIELWWSDGTPEGTVPLADLAPGPRSSNPRGFVRLGETTLFVAFDPIVGDQLYRADGSPPVISRVRTLSPDLGRAHAGPPFVAGAAVYFPVFHPVTGQELWVTDGTAEGTGLVHDLAPGPAPSGPNSAAPAGGRLVFFADDGVHGNEPWALDPGAPLSAPEPGRARP